jgi:hypothetical protein
MLPLFTSDIARYFATTFLSTHTIKLLDEFLPRKMAMAALFFAEIPVAHNLIQETENTRIPPGVIRCIIALA